MNRPGGNVTGVSVLFNVIVAKQFEVLHQAVPNTRLIGLLVNPASSNFASDTNDAQAAARALGCELFVVQATMESDFETAFAALTDQRVSALLVAPDSLFRGHVNQLAALAARHQLADALLLARMHNRRGPNELWGQPRRWFAAGRHLCGTHFER
jgi:putative ABC transport system substrate-binding protein